MYLGWQPVLAFLHFLLIVLADESKFTVNEAPQADLLLSMATAVYNARLAMSTERSFSQTLKSEQGQTKDVTDVLKVSPRHRLFTWPSLSFSFSLSFRLNPFARDRKMTTTTAKMLTRPLSKACDMELDNGEKPEACLRLAHLYLHGGVIPSNVDKAFALYLKIAETGHADAHAALGFIYSTGFANVTAKDAARGLIHHQMAAKLGNVESSMVLGSKSFSGLGMPKRCLEAVKYYKQAAHGIMQDWQESDVVFGPELPLARVIPVVLEQGGIYGRGASVASTGWRTYSPAVRAGAASEAGERPRDVRQYFEYKAGPQRQLQNRDPNGETGVFAFKLGKMMYHGTSFTPADQGSGYVVGQEQPGAAADFGGWGGSGIDGFASLAGHTLPLRADGSVDPALREAELKDAKRWFLAVARRVWPPVDRAKQGTAVPVGGIDGLDEDTRVLGAWAAGYLGRMAARGQGGPVNYAAARAWWERGSALGDRESELGLGELWRKGLIKDDKKAAEQAITPVEAMSKAYNHFLLAVNADSGAALHRLGQIHASRGEFEVARHFWESAVRANQNTQSRLALADIHEQRAQSQAEDCNAAVNHYKVITERIRPRFSPWQEDMFMAAHAAWERKDLHAAVSRWWRLAEMGFADCALQLAWILDDQKIWLNFVHRTTPESHTKHIMTEMYRRAAAQADYDALVKLGDLTWTTNSSASSALASGYYEKAAEGHTSSMAAWNLGYIYENGIHLPRDFHLAKRYYDQALLISPSESYLPIRLSLIRLYLKSFWYHVFRPHEQGVSIFPPKQYDSEESSYWDLFTSAFAESSNVDHEEHTMADFEDILVWDDAESGREDPFGLGDELSWTDDDIVETAIVAGLGMLVIYLFFIRAYLVRRRQAAANQQEAPR